MRARCLTLSAVALCLEAKAEEIQVIDIDLKWAASCESSPVRKHPMQVNAADVVTS